MRVTPRHLYKILFQHFGPQGWWPLFRGKGETPAYRPGNYRSPKASAVIEICLGALLTQNTAWSNVEKALLSLKLDNALGVQRLLKISQRRLERLIRSSGYFVQKAVKVKVFIRYVSRLRSSFKSRLERQPLAAMRNELLALHGVGPETADSMLLYAGSRPIFVVDAYTRRIGSRLGWYASAASYEDMQNYLQSLVPRSVRVYKEYHALFVALAKDYCRVSPRCRPCPVLSRCPTGSKKTRKRKIDR